MTDFKLTERAVLMRLSAGMPGKTRKDRGVTAEVKRDKNLGDKSGSWIKNRYPDWALDPIEKLVTKARAYHDAVTLPYEAGIGILNAPLIMEYGDRMRAFAGEFRNLCETHFRAKYPDMIEWAKVEHNGTFDPSDYPDIEDIMPCFYFRTEPVPVPDSSHFATTVSSLLGVDTESVTVRVDNAVAEANKELMRRLIAPVKAMAVKLAEPVPEGKQSPVFRDTLIGNVKQIAELAPKLNITGDPAIDSFVAEMSKLAALDPEGLRKSATGREQAAKDAAAMLAKLEGYKI